MHMTLRTLVCTIVVTALLATARAEALPASLDADTAAVAAAQTSGDYARPETTHDCPGMEADFQGWPAKLLRACEYSVGSGPGRRTAYVVLLKMEPRTIARWIETACRERLAGTAGCFSTALSCGLDNSGLLFPVSGNMMENMNHSPWRNYFFRNGMTVNMTGEANRTTAQIDLSRQRQLADAPMTAVASIPTGVTRLWRTLPRQFAALYPSAGTPRSVAAKPDQGRWLAFTQAETLASLDAPRNRLLDAWVVAHKRTLAGGKCPARDTDP